jgi:cyclic beta-1,2-glucan synthetase
MLRTIDMFAPLAEMRDLARAERWRRAVPKLTDAIEREAWDGEWYRRASYDDGTWLGTRDGDECQIDSIAQSWSVLSRHAEQARMRQAMESLDRRLIDWKDGLAVLFTPPFDQGERDPGYIKGYPPGLRENGGQYSHASMWSIFAFAELGDATKAHALFELLNPISHTRTSSDVDRYKVEPYVVAADVYSVQPHRGRGGWTWYTGSAAWMYRSGVEAILGLTREGDHFVIAPRMPQSWDGFVATLTLAGATYRIDVSRGKPGLKLDGLEVSFDGRLARIPIALDGDHQVVIRTA